MDIPNANCEPFLGKSERDLLAGILLASGGTAADIPNTAVCPEWGYGKYTVRDILGGILKTITSGFDPANPGQTMARLLTRLQHAGFWDSAWATNEAGSGTSQIFPNYLRVSSGTTASSRSARGWQAVQTFLVNDEVSGVCDWTKRFAITANLVVSANTTNGDLEMRFGRFSYDSGAPGASFPGVAIRIRNLTITARSHDGTNAHTTGTLGTVTVGQYVQIHLYNAGDGTMEIWINDALAGTIETPPATTDSTFISFAALNNADAANNELICTHLAFLPIDA